MKFFVKFTNPIQKLFKPITPGFLIERLIPLYVAWFIFIFRFYVFPLALGYSVMGILSFPLESEISRMIYNIGIFFKHFSVVHLGIGLYNDGLAYKWISIQVCKRRF